MDELLSLRQAAELLDVDIADVWRAAQEGSLEARKVTISGRAVWRFSPAAVSAWMRTVKAAGSAPSPEPPAADSQDIQPDQPGEKNSSPVESKLLDMLERSHQEMLVLQRQLLAVHQTASQGQRLLSENIESHHRERAQLLQEQARSRELSQQLQVARAELAKWQEQRGRPWWKRIFSQNTG